MPVNDPETPGVKDAPAAGATAIVAMSESGADNRHTASADAPSRLHRALGRDEPSVMPVPHLYDIDTHLPPLNDRVTDHDELPLVWAAVVAWVAVAPTAMHPVLGPHSTLPRHVIEGGPGT